VITFIMMGTILDHDRTSAAIAALGGDMAAEADRDLEDDDDETSGAELALNASSFHRYIDRIYVIAVEKRKKYMQKTMAQYGLAPIFFDAVLKETLKPRELIDEGFLHRDHRLVKGQIACHYSHMEVLKLCAASTARHCLVFEDDVAGPAGPVGAYQKVVRHVMRHVPDDFDVIYLGRCFDYCYRDLPITKRLVRAFRPQCRHAYVVSRAGAARIVEWTRPLRLPGDRTIGTLVANQRLTAYAVTPPLFEQNRKDIRSTVGRTVGNRETKECASEWW